VLCVVVPSIPQYWFNGLFLEGVCICICLSIRSKQASLKLRQGKLVDYYGFFARGVVRERGGKKGTDFKE